MHPPLDENSWSTEAEQELCFTFDALGRVTGEQGENGTLGWRYDALGNRTATQLPDGRELKQLYYGSGHLLSIALDNLPISDFTRDTLHREVSRTQGLLTSRSEYDRLGRLHRRDVFTGNAQRPAPRRWSRRWDYDYRNNLIREERNDNPFDWYRWKYDDAGRLMTQDGTLPGQEQWRWDAAGNPTDNSLQQSVRHNRVTQLNGIRWQYDIHGRTVEKDNGQTRWHYRYDGEHRLTEVISQPRDRNKPQVQVSFRYDPLGRRISKTRRQLRAGEPSGRTVTTRFVWDGLRLLQEIHDDIPLTYVYSDQDSYDPLARIDGISDPEIYWFHNQPNGLPERLTDAEGELRWEAQNSAWGKLLRETPLQAPEYAQNLRMQGQYLDRETGLHYNLFRYYDPDCGRFTQQDPIGLAGGINLYQYAPNALGWVDPWGLSQRKCSNTSSKQGHGSPKISNQPGTAVIHWHDNRSPTNTFGHYSVEVKINGMSLHTHQAGAPGEITMVTSRGFEHLPPAAKLKEVQLPKADEAIRYLGGKLEKEGPLYDLKTQSCVTHVCDVLRSGGVDIPTEPGAQMKYILKLLK